MNITILGASGFIGGNLRQIAARAGFQVTAHSSTSCNLLDADQTQRVLGNCRDAMNLIFCSAIGRAREDSREAMWKNIVMARNVMTAVAEVRLRCLVFMSSADVCGLPPQRLPISEDLAPHPASFYDLSKVVCENLIAFDPVRWCPATILRLPGIYGPGDEGRSVVGRLIRAVQSGRPVRLTARGAIRRDYVEVGDVCRLVLEVVANPVSGVFHVATGTSWTLAETVAMIETVYGRKADVLLTEEAGPRDYDLEYDPTKLRRQYHNWSPVSLKNGIRLYAGVASADEGA
ncbi:MAG: NAD(P)-dependent oxidoreductase [Phycisphaerae bacterium]|nr:NAD(P)-dependent oxidoreductase [Phycisphaerae bacterium]